MSDDRGELNLYPFGQNTNKCLLKHAESGIISPVKNISPRFRAGQLQAVVHQDKRDYGTHPGAFFTSTMS